MNRFLKLGLLALSAGFLVQGSAPTVSAAMGIARFRTAETAGKTTIVGFDDRGRTVARLDLVHGRFLPTEDFGPQYRNREVDGRKLNVEVKGQTFEWQTLGYSDTLHMPPLPPNLDSIAEFLADSRVRPLLLKWRIGWAPGGTAQTAEFSQINNVSACDYAGTNPVLCNGGGNSNITCPLRMGLTTPACNGGPEYLGQVISQDAATFGWEQDVVSMCCGNATNGNVARKTCAIATGTNGCPPGENCSSCGNSGGNKCKPCFTPIAYSEGCTLSSPSSGYVNTVGAPVVLACYGISPDPGRILDAVDTSHLWIGLKNSDDQGTRFDVRTEIYKNSTLVASGLKRCISGVTRNPNDALDAAVSFDALSPVPYDSQDVLSFKVLTRIGTNADDTKCDPGHNNATGLRLYYDSLQRQSRFGVRLSPSATNPGPRKTDHLHSSGTVNFLSVAPSTDPVAKSKDSSSINFSGGNVWKEVGTWRITPP